jgi:hypothetical protein
MTTIFSRNCLNSQHLWRVAMSLTGHWWTAVESTSWLTMVEPLLRSQRCLPRVSFFQKWNMNTSQNCAAINAHIDATTAPRVQA